MKRASHIIFLLLLCFVYIHGIKAQKKISELTIVYNYTLSTAKQDNASLNATNTVYIKGNMSRTEITNSLFSSSTIYDTKTGSAVVLKEINGQKLLIRMSPENWQDKNKRFAGLRFNKAAESKVIAGYNCEKATASTPDGFAITVFYTKDLVPENKDYDPQFKNLDGLPLEYEFTKGNLEIKYILSSINLNPVPASKFDIPKSGYREMTYEESKKLNVDK